MWSAFQDSIFRVLFTFWECFFEGMQYWCGFFISSCSFLFPFLLQTVPFCLQWSYSHFLFVSCFFGVVFSHCHIARIHPYPSPNASGQPLRGNAICIPQLVTRTDGGEPYRRCAVQRAYSTFCLWLSHRQKQSAARLRPILLKTLRRTMIQSYDAVRRMI